VLQPTGATELDLSVKGDATTEALEGGRGGGREEGRKGGRTLPRGAPSRSHHTRQCVPAATGLSSLRPSLPSVLGLLGPPLHQRQQHQQHLFSLLLFL